MGIQFHQFRKKNPWVVTWRNPWTGKKHTQGFTDEALAVAFEAAQAEIAAKERALLRKARKQKASQSRISVKDLLESYFRL
ncbi:MAG: site-specific integrase, partial [Desulfovibrio sp.]|nr:site-specific integrase [Desulfovibrio sp.]